MSCNNDDEVISSSPPLLPLNYDPLKHIYGTSVIWNEPESGIIIDPISGLHDTIPETKRLAVGFLLPVGRTQLFSFENNQRISIGDHFDELIIQDLTTYDYTTIDLISQTTNQSIMLPQFLIFGNSDNQIFIIDSDNSLWEIDLQNNTVERIIEEMIVSSNNIYISDIFYIKDSDDFILATTISGVNEPLSRELMLYDYDVDSIVVTKTIEGSFGFVQSPEEDKIFFLQAPTAQEGFRLMELKMVGGQMIVTSKSSSNLALDNLSGYLQTIHSGTNSYICRGGSNSFDMPTNFLYSIDLTTGELVNEVELIDAGLILSLSAE
jgi:hypothetical protein